jgi:hypothetical protein
MYYVQNSVILVGATSRDLSQAFIPEHEMIDARDSVAPTKSA